MELSKMFFKRPSFKVSALNKTFELNPLTVEGEIWIMQNLGEKFSEELGNMDLLSGTRLAFYLMKDEDKKKYFKKQTRTFITEEGDEITKDIGGVVLLQAIIEGQQEQIDMFTAIFQVIINSRPEIEEKKKKKITAK